MKLGVPRLEVLLLWVSKDDMDGREMTDLEEVV